MKVLGMYPNSGTFEVLLAPFWLNIFLQCNGQRNDLHIVQSLNWSLCEQADIWPAMNKAVATGSLPGKNL